MLFDHVEQQIKQKESFILQQTDRIKQMHETMNEMIEYEDVLRIANEVIHGGPNMQRLSQVLKSHD